MCAAVSVICELAQKNPKNYLSLAPSLFKLMNSSSNNIKIIKLVSITHRQTESSYSASTVHTHSLCCGCVMDSIISTILNRYQLVYEYSTIVHLSL